MKKIGLCVILTTSLTFSLFAQRNNPTTENAYKFNQILYYIYNNYVDTVNPNRLTDVAIASMLNELDPHSCYIKADDVNAANEPIVGNFEGVGIQYQMLDDTLLVTQPIAGSPAQQVGILPGDRIIKVDNTNITGVKISTTEIAKLLRGPKGSKVNVQVKRRGVSELIDFLIIRDKIPLYSVDASYMIAPKTGYIKLSHFSASTTEEFHKAIDELKAEGMKQLIIDLQSNGGGLMQAAIDMADQSLPAGKLIVYTQGTHLKRSQALSSVEQKLKNKELIILVDEFSASASEIVAGALQDWDRATIIGRRTFGKGLVQNVIPLSDGAQLRLTIARYYTPSGRNIQKPYSEGIEAYQKDWENRMKKGELMHADSVNFPDSLKFYTKTQHRVVYGGGGIWPDIFVPIDTTNYTPYRRNLIAKGVFNQTVAHYIDSQREIIKQNYITQADFMNRFQIPENLLQQLIDNGTQANIAFNKNEYERSQALLSLQLKAIIGRELYGNDTYYRIMNTQNPIVQAALKHWSAQQ